MYSANISPMMKIPYGDYTFCYGIRIFIMVIEHEWPFSVKGIRLNKC